MLRAVTLLCVAVMAVVATFDATLASSSNALQAIANEGLHHSQAYDRLEYLADVIGPRLTGSPAAAEAAEWAAAQLRSVGMRNVHIDPFPFGRGWVFTRSDVRMLSPQEESLLAVPEAWTPGTHGRVRGEAVLVNIKSTSDFARYAGKLRGKIVLLAPPRSVDLRPTSPVTYLDDKAIQALRRGGALPSDWKAPFLEDMKFKADLNRFLGKEGALAAISPSRDDGNVIGVVGYTFKPGQAPAFPRLVMAVEQYNRIARLLEGSHRVSIELNIEAHFIENARGYNVIGDIPGTTKGSEIVMAGAHLDSWHSATGATDDGAGVAALIEAARILTAVHAHPHRTIQIAFWQGEEEGLLGSQYYVAKQLGFRPPPTTTYERNLPPFMRLSQKGAVTPGPEASKFSAYFSVDSGTGKIRGIYANGDAHAIPVLKSFIKPLRPLGVEVVSPGTAGQSDDWSFFNVGMPSFFFIQDDLDYFSRTHHTNLDTFDYIRPDDLKQMSTVLASILYEAAMSNQKVPRD